MRLSRDGAIAAKTQARRRMNFWAIIAPLLWILCFYLFALLCTVLVAILVVCLSPSKSMKVDEFIKMVAEEPCTIEWYVTKKGVYRYSAVYGKLRFPTESTEPLEFPTNCELIEMRN